MVTLQIPCLHETGEAKHNQVVSDYHPLSREEIKELLDLAARDPNNVRRVFEIHVRLIQGIRGMICPRPPYDDPGLLARNICEVDILFTVRYSEGGTEKLVESFDKLLNWE